MKSSLIMKLEEYAEDNERAYVERRHRESDRKSDERYDAKIRARWQREREAELQSETTE